MTKYVFRIIKISKIKKYLIEDFLKTKKLNLLENNIYF